MEMKLDQAISIIKEAVAKIQTDLSSHQVIQQAVQKIETAIKEKIDSVPAAGSTEETADTES